MESRYFSKLIIRDTADSMRPVVISHLILTSPFSRPGRDSSAEEVGGGGEKEAEEEERLGQESPS